MKNEAFFIAAQAGVVPNAIGIPGVAKTAMIQAFAEQAGRQCYVLIGSLRDPADIGGYPYPSENGGEVHKSMHLLPPKWVQDCHDGDKWVIFLDELTTVPPAVQAAMLRVISERVVGDTALPEDTWIVAASNPPGLAANGFEIEPPAANRICHLQWQMDWESWDDGMAAGMDFPPPKFPMLPDGWEKELSGVGSLVAAFRKHRPTLFQPDMDADGNIKMDRAKLGAAWPSPRSWTNAAYCLAAAKSVGASETVQHQLVAGCVGDGPAEEFAKWQRTLDLPDPEKLLKSFMRNGKGKKAYQHPDRPDKVIAMLGSVCHAVLTNNTKERWEAGIKIIDAASEYQMDVAFACARPLARNIPDGARPDAEFINDKLIPVFQKIDSDS